MCETGFVELRDLAESIKVANVLPAVGLLRGFERKVWDEAKNEFYSLGPPNEDYLRSRSGDNIILIKTANLLSGWSCTIESYLQKPCTQDVEWHAILPPPPKPRKVYTEDDLPTDGVQLRLRKSGSGQFVVQWCESGTVGWRSLYPYHATADAAVRAYFRDFRGQEIED